MDLLKLFGGAVLICSITTMCWGIICLRDIHKSYMEDKHND